MRRRLHICVTYRTATCYGLTFLLNSAVATANQGFCTSGRPLSNFLMDVRTYRNPGSRPVEVSPKIRKSLLVTEVFTVDAWKNMILWIGVYFTMRRCWPCWGTSDSHIKNSVYTFYLILFPFWRPRTPIHVRKIPNVVIKLIIAMDWK